MKWYLLGSMCKYFMPKHNLYLRLYFVAPLYKPADILPPRFGLRQTSPPKNRRVVTHNSPAVFRRGRIASPTGLVIQGWLGYGLFAKTPVLEIFLKWLDFYKD